VRKAARKAMIYDWFEKKGVLESVPIDKIQTVQSMVYHDKLVPMAQFLSKDGAPKEMLKVMSIDGKYILLNGNHRVTVSMLSGLKDIKATVLKM